MNFSWHSFFVFRIQRRTACDLLSLTVIFTVLRTQNAEHLYFECFARIISLLLWIFSFKFIRHSSPESCLSVCVRTRVLAQFFSVRFVRLASFSVWHRWFWIKVTLFFVIADMHLHNLWIKCRAICISKDYYNVVDADADAVYCVWAIFPHGVWANGGMSGGVVWHGVVQTFHVHNDSTLTDSDSSFVREYSNVADDVFKRAKYEFELVIYN